MKDNRDKIIDLLKIECGLKGELVNLILESPGLNQILAQSDIMTTLENCILEINKVHDEVVRLEMQDTDGLNVKNTKN